MNWIVGQDWSDGSIATYGGSALGIVQNMAAPDAPAALKGQVVSVAFSDYYHQAAYQGHRIHIAVSSSNAPRFEPNANTGDPHPIAGQSRVATNTLHLSAERCSHVLLPVYEGAPPGP